MLSQIHILLTYNCNFECDHCFLYCGPSSEGTFTLDQIAILVQEADKMGTIEWFYFEGGEPFLFYPILVEGIKIVKQNGYKVGIVSNGYWATSKENGDLVAKKLKKLDVDEILVSNDIYHYTDINQNSAQIAYQSAVSHQLIAAPISIDPPSVKYQSDTTQQKAKPIIGGGVMFRGRAADMLTDNLPTRDVETFEECPYEDLKKPERVHIDSFGNVHICQGLVIGNCWEKSLSKIMKEYDPNLHPICSPLYRRGPIELAKELNYDVSEAYVDECHLCYKIRKAFLEIYPSILTPKQVYGK